MPVIVEGPSIPQLGRSIGEWVKANTIAVAERALREEVRRGFDPQPVVITDGMARRDYHQVKPFGRIEFARRANMADAVLWALDRLRQRSPVLTGRYASTHAVLKNGREITRDIRAALIAVKAGDRVQIVNPQPYAKKIEGRAARTVGRGTKRRRMPASGGISPQARSGVYRVVVRELVQRFGKVMFFDFKYVKLEGGLKWTGANGRTRDHVYPALQFFIQRSD